MRLFNIQLGKRKVRDQYQEGGGKFVSRWARPPSRNTAEWLEMYSKSPRLAVVEKIATDLASLRGHLYQVNPDGTETELTKHPFLEFMSHPNPLYEMTSAAMWRLNEIYLMLVGESFFLIERDEHERPIELWNVPPHWVKMTPYLGNPGYMITSPSGLTMTVPVEDMFVMKHLNPLDPFMRGLGVAESIADEVEIDEFAAQFQKRFFYNDGTPSVVFIMPEASENQRDAFMARWNKKHKGVENSHKAAAITGKVDIKTFGSEDIRELGFVESRISTRDAVLEHFGVPREIMGITENSNRSTSEAAQYIYAKNVLTPRINDREEAINQQLLPLFGDNLVWQFDPVIPYDKEFDKAVAMNGWNSGLLTRNQAFKKLGMPEIKGGDVYKVGINDLFMEQTADPVEVSQALGEKKSEPHVNVDAMLRKEDALLRENERRFEVAITRHFADQRAAIAKAMGLTAKAGTDALEALDEYLLPDGTFAPELWATLTEVERQQLTEAVTAGLLDWRDEAKRLTALFAPLWKQAYNDGAKLSAESYGLTGLVRPELVSQARINGGKRVAGIQETTQKNIAAIISRGVENGSSQNVLKKEIFQAMGPGTTRARAKLIAQQETAMSLATGQFDTMKAAGATTKEWHHRDPQKDPRDGTHGKVDHVHRLNGDKIGIDEPFSNGLMYPRDPECNDPKEVIRCRCYLTYEFGETSGTSLTPAAQDDILNNTEYQGVPVTDEAIERVPLVQPEGWTAEQAQKLQEAHRELLRTVRDRPVGTEAGAVYSLDMQLVTRRIGADGDQQIRLPHWTEPHIVIHNHPSGLTFSETDIKEFVSNSDMLLLIAVGNNGQIFALQKTDAYLAADFVKSFVPVMHSLGQAKGPIEYAEIMNGFLKGAHKYGILFISRG